jgi:hypothetical protein
MKLTILFAFIILLNACSSTQPKSQQYLSEPSAAKVVDAETDVDAPRALTPLQPTANTSLSLEGSGGGAALMAVVMGAVAGIGAILKSPEESKDIQGSCLYGDINVPAIATPCVRVKVSLLNDENKAVASMETNHKGEFRFYVPANRKYAVQVTDRKGRTAQLDKKAGRADIVSVYLKP